MVQANAILHAKESDSVGFARTTLGHTTHTAHIMTHHKDFRVQNTMLFDIANTPKGSNAGYD